MRNMLYKWSKMAELHHMTNRRPSNTNSFISKSQWLTFWNVIWWYKHTRSAYLRGIISRLTVIHMLRGPLQGNALSVFLGQRDPNKLTWNPRFRLSCHRTFRLSWRFCRKSASGLFPPDPSREINIKGICGSSLESQRKNTTIAAREEQRYRFIARASAWFWFLYLIRTS